VAGVGVASEPRPNAALSWDALSFMDAGTVDFVFDGRHEPVLRVQQEYGAAAVLGLCEPVRGRADGRAPQARAPRLSSAPTQTF